MVKDLKLSEGLKSIFWAEIFAVISTLCLLIPSVDTITDQTLKTVFEIVGGVLLIVAFVMLIIGLTKIRHGNSSFAFAFWWFFVSLLLAILSGVFAAIGEPNSTLAKIAVYLNVFLSISNFVIVVAILSGIVEKLKKRKTEKKFIGYTNLTMCLYAICALLVPNVLRLIEAISSTPLSTTWQWVFLIVELVLSLVGYISYIIILNKASKKV